MGGFRTEVDVREGSVRRLDTQGNSDLGQHRASQLPEDVQRRTEDVQRFRTYVAGLCPPPQGHSTPKPRVLFMNGKGCDPTAA